VHKLDLRLKEYFTTSLGTEYIGEFVTLNQKDPLIFL